MAVYDLAVWGASDFGINAGNYQFIPSTLTLNAGASADVVSVNDTDSQGSTLNDGQPGSAGANPIQFFTGTVNGTSYTNQPVNPENAFNAFDSNGNFVGQIYSLTFANSAAFSQFLGYAASFNIVPGETYTLQNADNTPDVPSNFFFVCFTSGSVLQTEVGPTQIEDVSVGTRVPTRDHGVQTVRWIGQRTVSRDEMQRAPALWPVKIAQGALGPDSPARDMHVSQLHRLVVGNLKSSLLFGEAATLIYARDLCDDEKIRIDQGVDDITYIHILFDSHEIVTCDGVESESFHPNQRSLSALDFDARAELFKIFPQLAQGHDANWPVVLPMLRGPEADILVDAGRAG